MDRHQHTVIGLLIAILVIRLVGSGRLQSAWRALTNAATPQSLAQSAAPVQQPNTPNIQGGGQGGGFANGVWVPNINPSNSDNPTAVSPNPNGWYYTPVPGLP